MLERFRPKLKIILEPIAKRINVNPNVITIISPFIALISAIFFATQHLFFGGLFILISGIFDILDGAVARYNNKTSDFGAILDSTIDRFSDTIIIIGLIFGGYATWFIGVLAIHSAITVSYIRARAESKGIPCTVGIAERAVRLIILMLGVLIAVILNNSIYMNLTIILVVILSYITVFQRIYHVWKFTSQKEKNYK